MADALASGASVRKDVGFKSPSAKLKSFKLMFEALFYTFGKPAGAGRSLSNTPLSNRLSAISPNSAECTKTKPTDRGFSVLTPAQTVGTIITEKAE